MQRPAPAPPVECNRTAAEAGTGCFSEAFIVAVLPYVTAIGLGVVAGALTGLLVAQLLIGRERPISRRPSPGASTAYAAPADARWSTARYNGACHNCGSSITAGDRVLHRPRQTHCASCG